MKVWSAHFAKLGAPLPELLSLSGVEARIILALRHAIICQKLQRNPMAGLEERLGIRLAVTRFLIVLESVGNAWPDNFHLGRNCCRHTTADEITLLQMIRCCALGDRPAYDQLLCEMMDEDARNRVFIDISNFVSAYQRPTPG
ncbi:MAG: hypothetical protein AAF067_03025 [Pseudomonadota bacterium]